MAPILDIFMGKAYISQGLNTASPLTLLGPNPLDCVLLNSVNSEVTSHYPPKSHLRSIQISHPSPTALVLCVFIDLFACVKLSHWSDRSPEVGAG